MSNLGDPQDQISQPTSAELIRYAAWFLLQIDRDRNADYRDKPWDLMCALLIQHKADWEDGAQGKPISTQELWRCALEERGEDICDTKGEKARKRVNDHWNDLISGFSEFEGRFTDAAQKAGFNGLLWPVKNQSSGGKSSTYYLEWRKFGKAVAQPVLPQRYKELAFVLRYYEDQSTLRFSRIGRFFLWPLLFKRHDAATVRIEGIRRWTPAIGLGLLALSVGAMVVLALIPAASSGMNWSPLAPAGEIGPRTRTSVNWAWRKQSPFKPDVVEEGGNALLSPDQTAITDADCVSLLTTSGRPTGKLFSTTGATSAATALVSRQAAILVAENPQYWPETIRGLVVHTAEWTERMYQRSAQLDMHHSRNTVLKTMLRTYGFGVPDLERARYSAGHRLTLVAQDDIQPFIKDVPAGASDAKLKEMHLYQLPWPTDVLQSLDPDLELRLKVTLSYFVEPNPRRRGYRNRFAYASHGLRFEVIRPEQSLSNFRAFINRLANDETYSGPEGSGDGWRFGPQLRTRGSLHSDVWTGTAAQLAAMGTIAVFPVSGWWKSRDSDERWNRRARYSLIVSIESPDEAIDLYTEVENLIETEIEVGNL